MFAEARKEWRDGILDFQSDFYLCGGNSSWGMFGGVVSVSGFPNPKMLDPVQHGYEMVVENSWELL